MTFDDFASHVHSTPLLFLTSVMILQGSQHHILLRSSLSKEGPCLPSLLSPHLCVVLCALDRVSGVQNLWLRTASGLLLSGNPILALFLWRWRCREACLDRCTILFLRVLHIRVITDAAFGRIERLVLDGEQDGSLHPGSPHNKVIRRHGRFLEEI